MHIDLVFPHWLVYGVLGVLALVVLILAALGMAFIRFMLELISR